MDENKNSSTGEISLLRFGIPHTKLINEGTSKLYEEGVQIPKDCGVATVEKLSGGYSHSVIVMGKHNFFAMGDDKSFPGIKDCFQFIQERDLDVVDVQIGRGFLIVQTATGKTFSFGRNDKGQLGLGGLESGTEPRCIPGLLNKGARVRAVACGEFHAVAVMENGLVYTWG
eukprot:29743_1